MNVLYVIATAITVSIDSFIAGFSIALNKKKNLTLPLTVACVTYILCVTASVAGTLLKDFLENYVGFIGMAIMLCLGTVNLFKPQNENLQTISFTQCIFVGFAVGMDGAAAALSLTLQGIGDIVFTPILFSFTHFLTVHLGQCFAGSTKLHHTNYISAAIFYFLAIIRILE